jgi:glycosyltransferase involved in cell wall biosynthesis
MPKFTIIVPSFNGGDYLKLCVESVLAQTYPDFDLAVLDNCSQDGTVAWLNALNDPRIQIYSSTAPLTIEDNWARALEIPKNEFMTFFGHDDLMDPNYLEAMHQLILRDPGASLYFAHFRYIDERGRVTRSCRPLPERETADQYIAALFTGERDTYGTGYMMRSAIYHEVGGMPMHERLLFADDALWIKLMRRTYKATAPEECFSCRVHSQSTGASADWQWWCNGMRQYAPFLTKVASEDERFAFALYQHGPHYFYYWCQTLYARALVQATKQNKVIDASVKQTIIDLLEEIAPDIKIPSAVIESFKVNRKFRFREEINRNVLGRWMYNSYILLRYGEWREKQLRRHKKADSPLT